MIDRSIFRKYDIRGDSRDHLTEDVAYNVGYYFAKMNIQQNNNFVVVGYDARLSTPVLYKALVSGLKDAGAKISSLGLVPTPVLYFSDKLLKPAASIMVTGSHNPKYDNGFKMLAGGTSFAGEKIDNLYNMIYENPLKYNEIDIEVDRYEIIEDYISRIMENIEIQKDLSIIWDPGNGAACTVLTKLIERLPNKNFVINGQEDGNFPSHHPDPTIPENLEQLIAEVKSRKADIGIAFDGDADRIGVVTRSGKILFGDQLLCIYAKELLQRKPGSTIIADVKASKTLFDYINNLGGNAIMWKTGHSLIKSKMIETKAEIAGEMSGHIFFADNYLGYDDAIYAALRLISIISNSDEKLDEIVDKLPEAHNTPEIRLDVDDSKKFEIVSSIKDFLFKQKIPFNDVDGIRMDLDNGWWLLRPSNTQPALIARCEANSKEELKFVIRNLNKLLLPYQLIIDEELHG